MDKIYIIFDVNGQRLKRNNPNLITVGGSYGLVKAKFNLPLLSAWSYCDSIVASFKSESFGPISYTIDSVTNECFVPQEVLKERWFDVTLSGYEGTEIKITSTSVRNEYLGRFEDTPAIPEEPIPDVYAQFLRDILTKGDRVVFANGFLSLYSGDTELSKTPIAGGGEASQIQLRVFDGWIQTSYVSDSPVWVNLIALTELQGPTGYTPIKGVDYFDGQKGDPGTPGLKGDPGPAGYTPIKGVDYFDGQKGDPGTPGLKGDPGPAGYTPIKGVDYFDGLKGDPGTPGLKGDPGPAGYTPIKGVDYFDGAEVTYSLDNAKLSAVLSDATADTTIEDTDTVPFTDISVSNSTKKITWADIKARLKTYFDTLYTVISSGSLIADATTLSIELSKYPAIKKTATLTTCTSLTITLPSGVNWYDEFVLYFTTSTTPLTVTLPIGITWAGGTPTFSTSKTYIISIQNGIGVVANV